jgi:hypothetical protein
MEVNIFDNSTEARRAMAVKMFRYEQWCKTQGLDVEDDNNWNSFSEMMNNR